MTHFNSNILSDIYFSSIGSVNFRFARTTSDSNTCRLQKQDSKHSFLITMLNKLFSKRFHDFKVFAETADNFIKLSSLHKTC